MGSGFRVPSSLLECSNEDDNDEEKHDDAKAAADHGAMTRSHFCGCWAAIRVYGPSTSKSEILKPQPFNPETLDPEPLPAQPMKPKT